MIQNVSIEINNRQTKRQILRMLEGHAVDIRQDAGLRMRLIEQAIMCGQEDAIALLLDFFDTPFYQKVNCHGLCVLHKAVVQNMHNVVAYYLDAGHDVDTLTSWNKATSLIYAARLGYTDLCVLLLSRGANPNAQSAMGITPLMAAAKYGHTEVIEVLLQHKASLEYVSGKGKNVFAFADEANNIAVCLSLAKLTDNYSYL